MTDNSLVRIIFCTLVALQSPLVSGQEKEKREKEKKVGSFLVAIRTDPISDEDSSGAITLDKERNALSWACSRDGLHVAFDPDRFLIGRPGGDVDDDTIDVQYRFPPAPAVKGDAIKGDWWVWSGDTAFLPVGKVREFTNSALASRTVVLRVYDIDGDNVTATFDLDGLGEVLKLLPCSARSR